MWPIVQNEFDIPSLDTVQVVEVASVFLVFLVKRRHISFLQHIKHTAVYGKGSGRVSVKQLDTQLLETSKTTTKKQQEQHKPVCVCMCVSACVCVIVEEDEGKSYAKQN